MKWTDERIKELERAKRVNLSNKSIGAILGCSATAVRVKWGKLKRKTKKPAQKLKNNKKHVWVYGDLHYPYQDDNAIDIAFEIGKAFDPDMVIINGDLLNFHKFAFFRDPELRKPPGEREYKDEIELAKEHLQRLRNQHPNAEIVFNPSNHEDRLFRYIADNAPALLESDAIHRATSLPQLLEFDKLEIRANKCVGGESYEDLGNILVGHWKKYSKHAGYTAKALIEELGISVIQGHTHHMGSHDRTWIRRQVVGFEGGCLCSLIPNYKQNANWQAGFDFVTFVGKYFSVAPIRIVHTNSKMFAIFAGKIYERAKSKGRA